MRTRRSVAPSYARRPRLYRTAPSPRSEARSPLGIQGRRPSLSHESPGIFMHPAEVSAHPCAVTRSQLRRQGRRAPCSRHDRRGCQHHGNSEDLSGHESAPAGSADEAVRAVRILHEILRIPARVSTAVLREEDAVGVTSPSWTGASHVLGSETLGKVTSGHGVADVFDEPAHERSLASMSAVAEVSQIVAPVCGRSVRSVGQFLDSQAVPSDHVRNVWPGECSIADDNITRRPVDP